MTNTWAFDIDGVLVDSQSLVSRAYDEAGCPVPQGTLGVHWKVWMPGVVGSYAAAVKAHELKTEIYLELLETNDLPELPGAELARALQDRGTVVYVTSSAFPAAVLILNRLGLDTGAMLGANLNRTERVELLRQVRNTGTGRYVYFDDRADGKEVADQAGWSFTHAVWS